MGLASCLAEVLILFTLIPSSLCPHGPHMSCAYACMTGSISLVVQTFSRKDNIQCQLCAKPSVRIATMKQCHVTSKHMAANPEDCKVGLQRAHADTSRPEHGLPNKTAA
jgi:hypothetical protein